MYHLRDGQYEDKLFPGVATYRNKLGGLVHTFSGVPKGNFDHVHAFSMLNQSRKKMFIKLLEKGGNLPIYLICQNLAILNKEFGLKHLLLVKR